MHFKPIENVPKLHVTPLAHIAVEFPKIIVDADDDQERRIRIIFEPYQAMQVITSDCYDTPGGLIIIPQTIVEIVDSEWIVDMKRALNLSDRTATFLEKSRHFLLPLQDDFLEIVAWGIRWQPM
jgi:hypothetical protein